MDRIGRIYLGELGPSNVIVRLALGMGWTSLVLPVRLLANPAPERKK